MADEPPGDASTLQLKGTGHDQRRCRFLVPNPGFDRANIPEGKDRKPLPLFLCLAREKPAFSTMVKCKWCREHDWLYQPLLDSQPTADPGRA